MSKAAISVRDLTYRYGDLTAVDRINFEVGEGEVLGFLGPNGAGKTTTVRMLTGQLKPSGGSAQVLGEDISRAAKQVQQYLGVSFETTNLYEDMSALENLELFARLFNVRHFDAMALLEKVGLGGREKDRVSSYSKGMKQRLMLARALINQPRILFLDEPTDGLDPVSSQTIHAIIREASANGTTVFLTTHDMVEADKLSHRVAFINQGRIAAMDQPAVLKQRYGKRTLKIEEQDGQGGTQTRSIPLDGAETAKAVEQAFASGNVLTAHTEEATLEDIFIQITGRGLLG
ncbi:MAG: type transport system ATP-binding protein [Chloroflexota bacterium]|nr:type transport system ATP-binding protein [Chloroflexota bacterium]